MTANTLTISPPLFTLQRGDAPVLISIPHDGGWIPETIASRLRAEALHTPDRDWHVARLYHWAKASGFSLIQSRVSRYVVDLNRPPDNQPLYAGANTPGLCPLTDFNGQPLYRPGQEPDAAEINQRVADYWRPYHQALENELERLRQKHGQVVLWDGHSIRSQLPGLFSGRLPDFNLGTYHGRACEPSLQTLTAQALTQFRPRAVAVNGRFVGGYITRHYGQPAQGIHALQMEIAQRVYLDEKTGRRHHGQHATALFLQRLLQQLAEHLLTRQQFTPARQGVMKRPGTQRE